MTLLPSAYTEPFALDLFYNFDPSVIDIKTFQGKHNMEEYQKVQWPQNCAPLEREG